jgi:superfamily II DNA or RNA helicase
MAGALQAVYLDMPNRDFIPDIQQEQAIEALGGSLVMGEDSGYFEMATGTGKTLVEVALAEAAIRAGERVHILAPTIQIAEQIYGEDGATGFGRFTNLLAEGRIRRNYGSRRGNAKAAGVISTYPGLLAEMQNPRLGRFGALVNDECHRSLGPMTSKAVTEYMPGAVRYGFSATPDYAEDRKSEEVYGKRLFEFSLRTAIESDKTAPIRALLYETGHRLDITDSQRDFTEAELAPLIEEMDRNGIAIKMARDLVADGRQGIIACVSGRDNAHARLMAHILSNTEMNGRKIIAADIGSHLTTEEQKRRLQDYKNGKIDILTFTKTLEEGWDSDRASFCINLSPTTSPVRIKQLMGRIMRKKKNGKEGIFVDFVDEKFGIAKQQYTALHALEVEDIDVHRVIGKSSRSDSSGPRPQEQLRDISEIFDPRLYARLLKGQGKLLQDVLITALKNPIDPLVAEWDRTLAREKPPLVGELPYNPTMTVTFARSLGAIARKLRKETGLEPTTREVLAASPTGQQMLRGYGVRLPWKAIELEVNQAPATGGIDTAFDTVYDPATYVEYLALRGYTLKALKTLTEREAGVMRLTYQLNDGEMRTLDEIGAVYGVTRERVRQIQNKALTKLMQPVRSQDLRPFQYPDEESPPYGTPRTRHAELPPGKDIFDDITVPIFDEKDSRPYNARLKEACDRWLTKKLATQGAALTRDEFVEISKGLRPAFIQIHGKTVTNDAEARQHYQSAIKTMDEMLAKIRKLSSQYGVGTRVGRLVESGKLTIDDVELILNTHTPILDTSRKEQLLDYNLSELRTEVSASNRSYQKRWESLIAHSARWHQISDPGIVRGYKKPELLRAMIVYTQGELVREAQALMKVRLRITNRPHSGKASVAKQASLMVIDTKMDYIKRRIAKAEEDVSSHMNVVDTGSSHVIF